MNAGHSPDADPGPVGGPGPGGGPSFGRGGRGRGGPGGPRGGGHRGGFGRPGGWQQAELPPADDAAAWFTGRLPSDWFVGPASVSVDREEIIVTGQLPPVGAEVSGGNASTGSGADADAEPAGETPDPQGEAAAAGRISRFREDTRIERMKIAAEAEARYGRKVAWGAQLGNTRVLFTHLSVPVMTRLRQPERQVLDTLVDAGVARSRSEALAWAVNLVGQHTEEWLASLRQAMSEVDKLRAQGPDL